MSGICWWEMGETRRVVDRRMSCEDERPLLRDGLGADRCGTRPFMKYEQ
jgi:hypothetical protein